MSRYIRKAEPISIAAWWIDGRGCWHMESWYRSTAEPFKHLGLDMGEAIFQRVLTKPLMQKQALARKDGRPRP